MNREWAGVAANSSSQASVCSSAHPFKALTRKHGVRCEKGRVIQLEEYVKAMANVVGQSTTVAASKMYGRAVFFLKSEAEANKAIQKGIVEGGLFVQVEPLSSLGTWVTLSNIPPFMADNVVLPFLE